MKKEIRFLWDIQKCGLEFKQNSTCTVTILQTGICGYIERYASDSTMESNFGFYALVEFENGKIVSFQIDSEIHIAGNAE